MQTSHLAGLHTVNADTAGANSVSLLAPNLQSSLAMHLLFSRLESKVVSARATPWSIRTDLMPLAASVRRPALDWSSSSGALMLSNSLTGSGWAAAVARRARKTGGNIVLVRVS